ncbi:SgcJ/EcaC family oxidoreductase [Leifsonia sp. ZF2019]|uniref:YybH family protein n=1 Tax=Leifsonia sp. ZF2019 TaxID=2781978 RepID=UPI001CBEC656|nr:SgcJ/EcaC family oxidoreductase [Leifsonia sp. ZF2019]UAJ80122.1 SgcJ/EcaC family oxidoreductase [Leifsonia sp. ZF2019]
MLLVSSLSLTLLGVTGCSNPATGTTCTGSPSVVLQRFTESFNQHDAHAIAALFSPDATFINIFGMRMEGRTGIESGHRKAFRSRLVTAVLVMKGVEKQELAPDKYVLYGTWNLAQPKSADSGRSVPAGSGILTAVVQCASGDWQLRAAANVRQASPPS